MMRRSGFAGLALAAVLVGVAAAPATALPPGGAGSDTPGTSASVSPTTLSPCGTLAFTLSGFPAGETVYVKIDDGIGYGDASVQGTGVVHMQAIPASGTVNGSFALPCGITPGAHWLRFLASAFVDPNDTSKGTIGYTHAGGTDFTVVAAADAGAAGSGGSSAAGGSAGAEGDAGAASSTGAGGVLAVTAAPQISPTPTASATASPTARGSATPAPAEAASPAAPASRVPWLGIGVAGALVVAAGVAAALLLVRRRAPGQ